MPRLRRSGTRSICAASAVIAHLFSSSRVSIIFAMSLPGHVRRSKLAETSPNVPSSAVPKEALPIASMLPAERSMSSMATSRPPFRTSRVFTRPSSAGSFTHDRTGTSIDASPRSSSRFTSKSSRLVPVASVTWPPSPPPISMPERRDASAARPGALGALALTCRKSFSWSLSTTKSIDAPNSLAVPETSVRDREKCATSSASRAPPTSGNPAKAPCWTITSTSRSTSSRRGFRLVGNSAWTLTSADPVMSIFSISIPPEPENPSEAAICEMRDRSLPVVDRSSRAVSPPAS